MTWITVVETVTPCMGPDWRTWRTDSENEQNDTYTDRFNGHSSTRTCMRFSTLLPPIFLLWAYSCGQNGRSPKLLYKGTRKSRPTSSSTTDSNTISHCSFLDETWQSVRRNLRHPVMVYLAKSDSSPSNNVSTHPGPAKKLPTHLGEWSTHRKPFSPTMGPNLVALQMSQAV